MYGIKTTGTLWAWGYNDEGQLGQNNRISRSSPVQVGTDTNWSIATPPWGTLFNNTVRAIKTNGTLWAWGDDTSVN